MVTTPAAASTVTLALTGGRTAQVLAEMYGDHLAVTPSLGTDLPDMPPAYLGHGWTVTHVPSGRTVRRVPCCIRHGRALARALADARIDWGRPHEDLAADPAAKTAVRAAVHRHVPPDCAG